MFFYFITENEEYAGHAIQKEFSNNVMRNIYYDILVNKT
jgi:hypothetical protein